MRCERFSKIIADIAKTFLAWTRTHTLEIPVVPPCIRRVTGGAGRDQRIVRWIGRIPGFANRSGWAREPANRNVMG
jgi:hypothetical protein